MATQCESELSAWSLNHASWRLGVRDDVEASADVLRCRDIMAAVLEQQHRATVKAIATKVANAMFVNLAGEGDTGNWKVIDDIVAFLDRPPPGM